MRIPLVLTALLAACQPEEAQDTGARHGPGEAPGDDGGGAGGDGGGDGGGTTGGDGGGTAGGNGGTTGDGGGASADCPEDVICVDSFPFVASGDTSTSSRRDLSAYACAPDTDESGPEVVYQVDLDEDGYLAASLDDWDRDVDVHILGSLDALDCIDRGHLDAGSLLPAGRYYVVVDTWVDAAGQEQAGQYDLYLGHTAAGDFEHLGLDREVLARALHAFDLAWMAGETERFEYTLIDFSLPSTDKRQWTLDLVEGAVLWNLYVAHGEGSGSDDDPRYADTFSNEEGSHQSSLGLMRTAETYTGDNGYALRLDGLEAGINDAVRDRAIVVHGADYATQAFVDDYGYLGRSWGCPAIDDAVSTEFIDQVEDGTLYWTWYPDEDFLDRSDYLP